jgi:hypothetical protein
MFEFSVKDLTEGDEFTLDNGQTWHLVLAIYTASGAMYHVICLDGWEFEKPANTTVIVK